MITAYCKNIDPLGPMLYMEIQSHYTAFLEGTN